MVSYLCDLTTHRGQRFHPTPPPCFTKQGKTRTKMLHNQKMYFIQMLRYGSLYYLCAVMAGFGPANLQRDKLAS